MSIAHLAEKLGIPPGHPDTTLHCVRFLSTHLSHGEACLAAVEIALPELTRAAEEELKKWELALKHLKANHRGHPGAILKNGFAQEMREQILRLTIFLAWLEALSVETA